LTTLCTFKKAYGNKNWKI